MKKTILILIICGLFSCHKEIIRPTNHKVDTGVYVSNVDNHYGYSILANADTTTNKK